MVWGARISPDGNGCFYISKPRPTPESPTEQEMSLNSPVSGMLADTHTRPSWPLFSAPVSRSLVAEARPSPGITAVVLKVVNKRARRWTGRLHLSGDFNGARPTKGPFSFSPRLLDRALLLRPGISGALVRDSLWGLLDGPFRGHGVSHIGPTTRQNTRQ